MNAISVLLIIIGIVFVQDLAQHASIIMSLGGSSDGGYHGHRLTGTSKEPSSAIATVITHVLVSSNHAAPTHGHCRGFAAVRIDKGHFGDIKLDGLSAALFYAWPGPIYKGNGEIQAVIDERADGKQRDALATILYGGETNEGATHWWVVRR